MEWTEIQVRSLLHIASKDRIPAPWGGEMGICAAYQERTADTQRII